MSICYEYETLMYSHLFHIMVEQPENDRSIEGYKMLACDEAFILLGAIVGIYYSVQNLKL